MKHYIVITGYANSQKKLNRVIETAIKLKNKNENFILCYSSHYKPQDAIYDYYDYVVYDKENLILNTDLRCEISKKFGFSLTLGHNYTIMYPHNYHSYAHHTSICNGISLGVSLGYQYLTVMNYDCRNFCIDAIDDHLKYLKQEINIFYNYFDAGISTEFFSIDNRFSMTFVSHRSYDSFKRYNTIVYENVFKNIIEQYYILNKNLKYKIFKNTENDGVFGDYAFVEDGVDYVFRPFIELENKELLVFLPFIDHRGKKILIFSNDDQYQILINDEKITDKNVLQYNDKFNIYYLPENSNFKVCGGDCVLKDIDLFSDEKYGFVLNNYSKIPQFFSKNP